MSTKIIAIVAASMISLAAAPPITAPLLVVATSEKDIKKWASEMGASRFLKFKENHKEVFVILMDTASGVTRESIFIYHFERNEWNLFLFRRTNGPVKVENSGKALLFKNSKGALLLEQPFVSIGEFKE